MIISGYQRYIGVTEDEEAIVRDALTLYRIRFAKRVGFKYLKPDGRAHVAERLKAIEDLIDRVFPTGETQAEAYERLEREAAALPSNEKRDRVLHNMVKQLQEANRKGTQ